MNLKQKALELIKKFSTLLPYYSEKDNTYKSIKCAIIAVDEIIAELKSIEFNYDLDLSDDIVYQQKVKQELKKML